LPPDAAEKARPPTALFGGRWTGNPQPSSPTLFRPPHPDPPPRPCIEANGNLDEPNEELTYRPRLNGAGPTSANVMVVQAARRSPEVWPASLRLGPSTNAAQRGGGDFTLRRSPPRASAPKSRCFGKNIHERAKRRVPSCPLRQPKIQLNSFVPRWPRSVFVRRLPSPHPGRPCEDVLKKTGDHPPRGFPNIRCTVLREFGHRRPYQAQSNSLEICSFSFLRATTQRADA